MQTRIIHTKFWQDEFISELTPTEKLLFIYFLTNDQVNIIHCYEISDRRIIFDTGVSQEELDTAKKKFNDSGKILVSGGYVYLYNASKYETYSGEKNLKAKEKLLARLPDKLKELLNTRIDTPIDTPLIGSINHKSEIINNKSELINQNTEFKKDWEEMLKELSNSKTF